MIFQERKGADAIDVVYPGQGSTGERIGFGIEAMSRAHESARMDAPYAISNEMSRIQNNINKKLKDSGEAELPLLPYVFGQDRSLQEEGDMYDRVASYITNDTGSSEAEKAVGKRYIDEYNKNVNRLREKRPDLNLPLLEDQFEEARKNREDAQQLWRRTQTTVGGAIAGFIGGMGVSFNPYLDPVSAIANIATLGAPSLVAKGAKGVVALVKGATEAAGVNAGIELTDQLTGAAKEKRLFSGEPTSVSDIALQTGAAGLGGAALHAAGTGIAYVGKKAWFKLFKGAAEDIAPTPLRPGEEPAMDMRPEEAQVLREDRDVQALRDSAPEANPQSVVNKGVAEATGGGRAGAKRAEADMAEVEKRFNEGLEGNPELVDTQGRTIDQAARDADPETFEEYNRIRDEQDKVRLDLERQKAYEERVNGEPSEITKANMQEKRAYLQFLDEKARDLAPRIGRAYARARGEWLPSTDMDAAVRNMVEKRVDTIDTGKAGEPKAPPVNEVSAAHDDEILREGAINPEETKAVALTRVVEKQSEAGDVALEKALSDMPKAFDEGRVPEGLPEGLDLEQKVSTGVVDEKGNEVEVALREFFQDSLDDERAMKAVSVCQINS